MNKTMMIVAAAATLAATAIAVPRPAEARGGFFPGFVGGLAAGAIVGGALAAPYYYGPPGYYPPGPYGYYGAGYYPGCYVQRQRYWDGFYWRVRRVQVCG